MDEYINRASLIDNLKTFAPEHYTSLINDLILKEPAADVVERKKGKWVDIPDDHLRITYQCSSCKKNTYSAKQYDLKGNEYVFEFCPHCGADMRGKT